MGKGVKNKHGFRVSHSCQGFQFKIGEIMRIGRLAFRVSKMSTESDKAPSFGTAKDDLENTQLDLDLDTKRRHTRDSVHQTNSPHDHSTKSGRLGVVSSPDKKDTDTASQSGLAC